MQTYKQRYLLTHIHAYVTQLNCIKPLSTSIHHKLQTAFAFFSFKFLGEMYVRQNWKSPCFIPLYSRRKEFLVMLVSFLFALWENKTNTELTLGKSYMDVCLVTN